MTIINSSAYQFTTLAPANLPALQAKLQDTATQLSLKGTILLSLEGINLALAGTIPAMSQFKTYLERLSEFGEFNYNDTYSSFLPFHYLLVKIKKQIIPYSDSSIPLEKRGAPYISPDTLFEWLQTERDILLLDTRNQYEVEAGSFENALNLHLKHFRDFPTYAAQLPGSLKKKPVVTFCTGGIRCEKASATLLQLGFQEVYQLQGGILSYFKQCGNPYYQGDCFVFDGREVINARHTREDTKEDSLE